MANIVETVNYDTGVYLIATSDAVVGGVGGIANLAAANLANRTAYLKSQTDTINATLPTLAPKLSPALTGTPTTTAPNVGDSSTQISTTAFVQITSKGRYALNVAGNSNVTLSATQAGYAFIEFVGTLTGNIVVTVPGSASLWTMKNSTSGAYTLTVVSATTGGSQFVLPQGGAQEVISDGQNVYSLGYLPLTGGTLTGAATLSYASPTLFLNALASGQQRAIQYNTNGSARWQNGATSGAESGSNAGSDWFLARYSDAGAYIDAPIIVYRSTGVTSLANRVLIGGTADDGTNTLQVSGSVRGANYFINNQFTGDSGLFGFGNANGPAVAAYGSGTAGVGALVFRTAGAERARVSAAGRLLIGTTTDDGLNPVQVYGPSGDGTGILSIAGGNTSGMGGAVSFAANVGSAPMSQVKGTLENRYSGGGYDQGGLAILTRPSGNSAAGVLSERMRVTSSGRVLIGTTADDGS
ncbi:TPA: hypothetical protein QDB28_003996, partial [Burkholderia vietnamiensis]|nr:hypothetical protein [Burkholderia vietnamiensis]